MCLHSILNSDSFEDKNNQNYAFSSTYYVYFNLLPPFHISFYALRCMNRFWQFFFKKSQKRQFLTIFVHFGQIFKILILILEESKGFIKKNALLCFRTLLSVFEKKIFFRLGPPLVGDHSPFLSHGQFFNFKTSNFKLL